MAAPWYTSPSAIPLRARQEHTYPLQYLWSTDQHCIVHLSFLIACSGVAPKWFHSMPRLEVRAALTGAQLAPILRRELTLSIDQMVLWADLTTVLAWLKSESCQFKVCWNPCDWDPEVDWRACLERHWLSQQPCWWCDLRERVEGTSRAQQMESGTLLSPVESRFVARGPFSWPSPWCIRAAQVCLLLQTFTSTAPGGNCWRWQHRNYMWWPTWKVILLPRIITKLSGWSWKELSWIVSQKSRWVVSG